MVRAQRKGRGELVKGFRRKQKRKPRRLLEAPPRDWERWDRYAQLEQINWSEFTRRALEQRCSSLTDLESMASTTPEIVNRLPGLSQKPPPKNGSAAAKKKRAAPAARKGSSRS